MAKKSSLEGREDEAAESKLGLSSLAPARGSRHRRKRLGLGESSGKGKTCGRGGKGQTARSGAPIPRGFEGGQMPLHRRLPKIGFTSRKKVRGDNVFATVAVSKLEELAIDGTVTLEMLRARGFIGNKGKVKILGGAEVTQKLNVEAHAVSASAKEAIEKAGGTVSLV